MVAWPAVEPIGCGLGYRGFERQSMTERDDPNSCETFLEYHGTAGATRHCAEAVERLLYMGAPLRSALILTHRKLETSSHALLLTNVYGDEIAIKSGFSSGYGGAGPKGFSATLSLLDWHGIELDEILVEEAMLDRLDASALTVGDLDAIRSARPIRPMDLWIYVADHDELIGTTNPWLRREPIVPLTMMDERLAVDARDFWNDPDGKLIKAHRHLEESVRTKAGISIEDASSGPARMYALAFNGKEPRLRWPAVTTSEQVGRANLFIGTLAAYRNPRVHRTEKGRADAQLAELLLLNHLYRLEASAEPNPEANPRRDEPT
jgi:hypothetical protein